MVKPKTKTIRDLEPSTFSVEIDRGPTQTITVNTGIYTLAAMAALAMLDYDDEKEWNIVKIWVPSLIEPDSGGRSYGPYFYAFDGHTWGTAHESQHW